MQFFWGKTGESNCSINRQIARSSAGTVSYVSPERNSELSGAFLGCRKDFIRDAQDVRAVALETVKKRPFLADRGKVRPTCRNATRRKREATKGNRVFSGAAVPYNTGVNTENKRKSNREHFSLCGANGRNFVHGDVLCSGCTSLRFSACFCASGREVGRRRQKGSRLGTFRQP